MDQVVVLSFPPCLDDEVEDQPKSPPPRPKRPREHDDEADPDNNDRLSLGSCPEPWLTLADEEEVEVEEESCLTTSFDGSSRIPNDTSWNHQVTERIVREVMTLCPESVDILMKSQIGELYGQEEEEQQPKPPSSSLTLNDDPLLQKRITEVYTQENETMTGENHLTKSFADATGFGDAHLMDTLVAYFSSASERKTIMEEMIEYQEAIRKLRENHDIRAPKPSKEEKYVDHLWNEFAELLKAAETTTTTHHHNLLPTLQTEAQKLEASFGRHAMKSFLEMAQEIVEPRQKRRKIKRSSSSSSNNPTKRVSATGGAKIEPWHVVLGDHSTRSRTLGTLALRYFCVHAKHSGGREPKDILHHTRTFLQQAFPTRSNVGQILYLEKTAARFLALDSVSGSTSYSFVGDDEDNNISSSSSSSKTTTTFVPILDPKYELDVVKHLYTKLTPSTERSLPDIVRAYRTMLNHQRASLERCNMLPQIQAFESVLDFCDKAEGLDLTQTAMNGLRETLDIKWAALTE